MKLAFIIDPIANLDPTHDTTVALMEACCRKGHEVFITKKEDLGVVDARAYGWLEQIHVHSLQLIGDKWYLPPHNWYEKVKIAEFRALDRMQVIWMRHDPPVTVEYIYATYVLDYVRKNTLLINSPSGIRSANEKMYGLQFGDVMPETIVSSRKDLIREFVRSREQTVIKPLDGKGGEGILFAHEGDRNLNSIIEISTKFGKVPVIIQKYLPAAAEGDKRIILLNGQPIGAINRIPGSGEFRGNMAAGGSVAKTEITDRDLEICDRLCPVLQRDGLLFVGIDIIGGYLTEINVTSPTGVREIDRLNKVSIGDQVVDWLESQVEEEQVIDLW
jgi:glutathione synthase